MVVVMYDVPEWLYSAWRWTSVQFCGLSSQVTVHSCL